MTFPDTAPETAAEASKQLHDLSVSLRDTRRTAARLKAGKDDAEALYKGQLWRVLAGGVEGRNGEEREAKAMTVELAEGARVTAAEIADRIGLKGWKPDTLDDLRWLRDRAEGIADACSAAAYDQRVELQASQSVVSWAKSEFEQTMRGN